MTPFLPTALAHLHMADEVLIYGGVPRVTHNFVKEEKGRHGDCVRGPSRVALGSRVHRNYIAGLFQGVISHWNCEKGFGWIVTDVSSMQQVPQAVIRDDAGRVYFHTRDCGPSVAGSDAPRKVICVEERFVVFRLYWNKAGVGACDVMDATSMCLLNQVVQEDPAGTERKLSDVKGLGVADPFTEVGGSPSELGGGPEKCTVHLVVTKEQGGQVIGHRGETVRTIKVSSGVDRIFVERGVNEHRQVELKGSSVAVAAAAVSIGQILAGEGGVLEVKIAVPEGGYVRLVGLENAHVVAIQARCEGVTLHGEPSVAVGTGLARAIKVTGRAPAFTEAVNMLVARVVTCTSSTPVALAGLNAGKLHHVRWLTACARFGEER